MATFFAVNTSLGTPAIVQAGHEQTPTTPRPSAITLEQPSQDVNVDSSPNTPTRHSFGGILGQRPLPDEPFTPSQSRDGLQDANASVMQSGSSQWTTKSQLDAEDVEMGEGDDFDEGADEDGSDNESITSDSQRPSKKKKGQRFFCTEFPPCQLSFTRSEHLARHIRKHTGERPFQCHCSRRFSRLDNLRQHAQTVHVNEEIPGDSLAATSTRFQRQIRTDRVRPPNRSRASTIGSQSGHTHARGHSRNLSASSIGSTTSSVAIPEESRRRPQPLLAMANDAAARARLSLDTYNSGVPGNPGQQYTYYNQSPTGYSTPTSTAFSTGTNSPRYQSGMTSPVSTISRSSFYNGARAPGRRLSVPAGNPFQTQSATYPQAYYGQNPLLSGTPSQNSSVFASPTSSVFSLGRLESESEMEYRRRTWHPSSGSQYSQRPATSGLSYYQTPDEPRPAMYQQPVAASQLTRLPGIESFDHAPLSSARQQPSPMMIDSSPRPPTMGRPMEATLQQGLNRLDITAANAPPDGHWQATQGATQTQPPYFSQHPAPPTQVVHPSHMSMPVVPITPRKNKRNAWYGGPIAPSPSTQGGFLRTSPEDSGSSDGVHTPSTTSQGNEYHPVIVNPAGPAETYHFPPGTVATDERKTLHVAGLEKPDPPRADSGYQKYGQGPTYTLQSGHDSRYAPTTYGHPQNNDMTKLEALVAVATSEGNRAVEHKS